ncbi:hypothetical protein P0Y35_11620 [Kiritimatiellaeota bacterium B1221]|nr:hypothetical protein [Kiritimatiellaeota bacterium B1221]
MNEEVSFAQKVVLALLGAMLPPHADNEQAAKFLRTRGGQGHAKIEWVAIRPDGLTDADTVTAKTLHPSPARSAVFDAGQPHRIHVADFMASLIEDDDLWKRWVRRNALLALAVVV